MYTEQLHNGEYRVKDHQDELLHPDLEVEPEKGGTELPTARKDDFLTALAKQVAIAAAVGALSAGAILWGSSARAEERLIQVQRQLISVQDDLKTEREARELTLRKIVALETQVKVTEELTRLNQNIEAMRKGKR